MIGGFSPVWVFGAAVGTLLGSVGWVGRGGPEFDDEFDTGVLVGVALDGVATVDVEALELTGDGDTVAGAPDEEVQAATLSAATQVANAAIVRIEPTLK